MSGLPHAQAVRHVHSRPLEGGSFDHIAIDATSFVGPALRYTKNCSSEPRRNAEVARHVAHSIVSVLKRFQPVKSLALAHGRRGAVCGSESCALCSDHEASRVAADEATRHPHDEGREERILKMLPEHNLLPPEVLFSGVLTEGCVEHKYTQWALDIASRGADAAKGSLCVFGKHRVVLNSLALTPFLDCTSIVAGSDFKQLHLRDLPRLGWARQLHPRRCRHLKARWAAH